MAQQLDDDFYGRAGAFINLANDHCSKIERGKASASFMYAVARFNAWVSATGFSSGPEMSAERDKIVEYFVEQYKAMLEENLGDYISNFDRYMKRTN